MSLYIGVDSGTQSTKAVVLDLNTGRTVAEAHAPLSLIEGLPEGHREQHPRDWIDALERVVSEATAGIDRTRVRGIGVSGQQHGFVPLDGAGEVIRPAKLWSDTSTVAECEILTRRLGGTKAVVRKFGLPFLPGYTAPKILWLKRHEPRNFRRLRHVLLPHDYLNFYLTGRHTMEPGDASGTALLDVRRRTWARPVIEAIDPRLGDFLPPLQESSLPAGRLLPAVAERLGLPPDIVVSAGGGDNMMGAIGTGNVRPGIITASFGTSGTIYACSRHAVVDPRGEIAAFCSSTGSWLPLLCTMNVTLVTELFRSLFAWDYAAMEQAVAAAPMGAGGLSLVPYFDGERTPNIPRGTGVLYGLNRGTTRPGHLARAAMEGVTLGMNYGLLRLEELGIRPREIRVTGGGARSASWRRIMADVFGVPIVGMVEDESAALGAAIQAAWCGLGNPSAKALQELTDRCVQLNEATRVLPDRKAHAAYRNLQEKQGRIASLVAPAFA